MLYLLCCVWTFLTAELTNETRAVEDVLREKEGKKIYSAYRVYLCMFEFHAMVGLV